GLPAVLVDATEEPVGLAAGAHLVDHGPQLALGLVGPAAAVEREAVLLADETDAPDGLGHRLGQADHVRPRPRSAIRQKEVHEDPGLHVVLWSETLLDRAHGVAAARPRVRELLFGLRRVGGLFAERVRLQPVDLRPRKTGDDLEDGAVV